MFALITDCNQIKQDNVVDIHYFVDRYGISVSQMTTIMLRLPKSQSGRFFHSWFVTGFVTKVTWQMPHVEQECITLTEHPGIKCHCLSFCPSSCCLYVVSPSIYGLSLPLWYLQTFRVSGIIFNSYAHNLLI